MGRRYYHVCPTPVDLPERARWADLKAIGMAVRHTQREGGSAVRSAPKSSRSTSPRAVSRRRCPAPEVSRTICTGNAMSRLRKTGAASFRAKRMRITASFVSLR